MNKSILTNTISALIVASAFLFPAIADHLLVIGAFALSGGLTNWLAVHMLFEKVPFLYGSGVIPTRFEDFKIGIKTLIMSEFFTRTHIERFLNENDSRSLEGLVDKLDFDRVFTILTEAIVGSPLGGMLAMAGGKKALEPLRQPITVKLKDIIVELATDGLTVDGDVSFAQTLVNKIEKILDTRLNELTPEHVKKIIANMIYEHLGWLVVWGGILGGLIGLVVSIFQSF